MESTLVKLKFDGPNGSAEGTLNNGEEKYIHLCLKSIIDKTHGIMPTYSWGGGRRKIKRGSGGWDGEMIGVHCV